MRMMVHKTRLLIMLEDAKPIDEDGLRMCPHDHHHFHM
jgi:hypothetical protein